MGLEIRKIRTHEIRGDAYTCTQGVRNFCNKLSYDDAIISINSYRSPGYDDAIDFITQIVYESCREVYA